MHNCCIIVEAKLPNRHNPNSQKEAAPEPEEAGDNKDGGSVPPIYWF